MRSRYLSLAGLGSIPLVSHNLGLGILYDQVSDAVGLNNEPGKLMGLAPYASPSPAVYGLVTEAIEAYRTLSFGKVIQLTRRLLEISKSERAIRRGSMARFALRLPDPELAMQAAANAQLLVQSVFTAVIGRILIQVVEHDPRLSVVDLTGGFTFNCPSNSMLQQQCPSMAVNPLPGAGDTGLPVGAAVLISYLVGDRVKRQVHSAGLTAAFPPLPAPRRTRTGTSKIKAVDTGGATTAEFIARNLADGKVMCLFRGRSEVGPRALGNRSIIATAADAGVRDRINTFKGRELWRPLAPICREEDFNDYFDGDPRLARYMLFTFRVLSPHVPAITHIDGTARVQCVTETDDWLHPALTLLRKSGHHPVIVNTSFNCAGEPLVETLDEAISSFLRMKLDYLVTEEGIYTASGAG